MTSTAALREALIQPGRAVNDAMRHYAGHNVDVPEAIKADPLLYGELARSALQWTADLLGAFEEAAAARPAVRLPVEVMATGVGDYFAASSRWPTVADLRDPLRLLIPAFHAVIGMRLVGVRVRPRPLLVEYAEPVLFMEEVLGQQPSMTIRQHANDDFESVPEVLEDPGDHEQLAFRVLLSARQRARLDEARAAPLRGPAEPAPVAAAEAVTEPADPDVARASMWTSRLSDSRITLREKNSFEPGYGGGSSSYSAQSFLSLFEGGRYQLEETITTSISGPGFMSGGEPRTTESRGAWSVEISGSVQRLRLVDDDGGVTHYRIASAGEGALEVDGEHRRWTSL